jgi:hypothetical protein
MTQNDPSLRELLECELKALSQRLDAEISAISRRVDDNKGWMQNELTNASKSVTVAMNAAEKAIEKAEINRAAKDAVQNEWRSTVQDLINGTPSRKEIDAQFDAVRIVTDELRERAHKLEGALSGIRGLIGYTSALGGLTVVVITVFTFINRGG